MTGLPSVMCGSPLRWPCALLLLSVLDVAQVFGSPIASSLKCSKAVGEPSEKCDDRAKTDNADGLVVIPKGYTTAEKVKRSAAEAIQDFCEIHKKKRAVVVIVKVGKGTKRHTLIEDLQQNAELVDRQFAAWGVQFAKGASAIEMYVYPDTEPIVYTGKWSKDSIAEWVKANSWPLIGRLERPGTWQYGVKSNVLGQYMYGNALGLAIVKQDDDVISDELYRMLEPYARKYREKFRFVYLSGKLIKDQFTLYGPRGVAPHSLENLGYDIGAYSETNVLMVLEDLKNTQWMPEVMFQPEKPEYVPALKNYRLDTVTPERVANFFEGIDAKTWPRYLRSDPRKPRVKSHEGIVELKGSNFAETVLDPAKSTVVLYYIGLCDDHLDRTTLGGADHAEYMREAKECREIIEMYDKARSMSQQIQAVKPHYLANVQFARMNVTINQMTEYVNQKSLPMVVYYPKNKEKKTQLSTQWLAANQASAEPRPHDLLLSRLVELLKDENAAFEEMMDDEM